MYWTIFWQPTIHVQHIFEKTLIEVGSSHLYASFGIFWVQICQLVQVQWDFKILEEFENVVIFLQKTVIFPFSYIFQMLTVPRTIDQFRRKRFQKKSKYVSYQFFKNILGCMAG